VSIRLIDVFTLQERVTFKDLIEPVGQAYKDFSASLAESGLITMFPGASPDLGDVYVKTGSVRGGEIFVVKVSPWFALNVAQGQPQGGIIAVFDSKTGYPLAIIDDKHYLSDIRTAAAGALAARFLAPDAVRCVALFGTGIQAFWQALALHHERPFQELVIWGRSETNARELMRRLSPKLAGVSIRFEPSAEVAVRKADVVITVTSAREPIIKGAWLRPGQHVTAIGADDGTKCELDALCLTRASRLIVDSRESAKSNGDVGRHLATGAIETSHIHGEMGEVLSGALAGRSSPMEITVAKFIGLGAVDLAAAEVALKLTAP